MNRDRRIAMIGALTGGTLIKAYPPTHPKPWIDYRGNAWSEEEVEEALTIGLAETLPVVRLNLKYEEAPEEGGE